jgi:DNA-binding Lrp family transcriptional regulator
MRILDDIDYKIITCLEENAKMSQKELASRIGLTITPTFERVKSLERTGVIEGYTVKLNKEKVERGLQVICQVSLKAHNLDVIEDFENAIVHLKEIASCFHIAGGYDYSLLIEVKNMSQYERFLKERLASIPNIVNVQSSFVMSQVKK